MSTPVAFRIFRVDDDGKLVPETEAQLVVGRRDLVGESSYPYDDLLATFVHRAEGHYINSSGDPENEPAPGEWLVVARKTGCNVVVQKLTLTEKDGILRASPGWNEPGVQRGIAATVSIVNFDQAKGQAGAAKQSLVSVRLFPSQRFVGVGCRDNHGGTRFTLFAQGRRDFLWDQSLINSGCIVTLFDCLENQIKTAVKGSKAAASDWLVVASSPPAGDKVSIVDFYAFMDAIGKSEPNTVVEAGIFGHAWHQGPLVQDTFDASNDLDARDPDDADGRPKDWFPSGTVARSFSKFKNAFVAQGRMVIWGCSHMINVSAEAAECNRQVKKGAARDEFFRVVLTDGGVLSTTLDYSARSIAQNVVSQRKGRFPEQGSASGLCTYSGVMARALAPAVQTFAAMPGAGSNFGSVRGPTRPSKPQSTHIAMLVVDEGENFQLKTFYEREFGALFERDGLKYLNYTKFLNVSLPEPPFSTLRFCRYRWDGPVADYLRLPSRLEVGRKVNKGGFELPVPFSREGEDGHLYVAKQARAKRVEIRGAETLVALESDPTRDSGFFVTQTGKTLLFERLKGSADFVLPEVMPRLFTAVLVRDPVYQVVAGDPGQPLVGNLIEQVVPKCFW
jgi:hypothetical protein